MQYEDTVIEEAGVPQTSLCIFQHLVKTYASEVNKLNSVWHAQLGVYLRMLNKTVPSIYGPTADVRWEGADPTSSVAAAGRK